MIRGQRLDVPIYMLRTWDYVNMFEHLGRVRAEQGCLRCAAVADS